MPFTGPEGQTFEDFEHCVETLSEDDDTSEEDAKEICGRWQSESKNEKNSIRAVDLTPLKNETTDEELQEYELGQIVDTPHGVGIVAAMAEETFEYPAGSKDRVERVEDEDEEVDMEEIEASEDDPVYIVALQEGGSAAVGADEISTDASLEGEGEDISSWDDVAGDAESVELAEVYSYCDNPDSRAELEKAKRRMIHEKHPEELAEYVESSDTTLAVLEELSSEELQNIPGVDDPHVGFNSMPNGWTRKSVLQAWASLGGMWRTCYPRMIRVRGPRFARRWCAALKDEVLRTEEWRGKF